MRLFGRPRIFISYSRNDADLTEALKRSLEERGFEVFYDIENIRAGEDFVERLRSELRNCDAVVALLTKSSAESPWCQAELYSAHALGIAVIPVRVGEGDLVLPTPLELIQRRIHFLKALGEWSSELTRQLQEVRRKRLIRQAYRAALALCIGSLVVLAFLAILERIDDFTRREERNDLIAQVRAAHQPLPPAVIQKAVADFDGDQELLEKSLAMAEDPLLTDATRLTAKLLAAGLLANRETERRWYIRQINWLGGNLRKTRLVDITFMKGLIEGVTFDEATLAGVIWNESPGMTLSNLRFVNSDFYYAWFAGTNVAGAEFVNSSFRGAVLDVTNFSRVRFLSHSSTPEDPTLITGEVAVFEDSTILNRNSPPEPGVLDLGDPTKEVLFDGVVFQATHFRGWIRPEWFKDCHFLNCVLPTSLREEDLLAGNNVVHNCTWRNEDLD
jgi:hypothetical protein